LSVKISNRNIFGITLNKIMRRYLSILSFLAMFLLFGGFSAFAQETKTFSDPNVNYSFEIPDPIWKIVVKPSSLNPNVELVYGDRQDGHLEVRKVTSTEEELLSDVITDEQEKKLQFLPGYVAGKDENFAGTLKGKVFNYEFVRSGKNMSGRIYFLKVDTKTIYLLRFDGIREKLRAIRNYTDQMARTFQIK
jgi:hypothetical protein